MKLSIVSTMYRSSAYVDEFCDRIGKAASAITDDFEIVLVNDGSPDDALEVAIARAGRDIRVRVVDLSRNFGHHPAILTGLKDAVGEHIFLIDIDLEEPPELLSEFWAAMNNGNDIDVVGGVQTVRKGKAAERYIGGWSWSLFSKLSGGRMQANLVTARLMTRRYVDSLLSYPERQLFLAAVCSDVGFNQVFLPVHKTSDSETSYTLRMKLSLFLNGLTSFSTLPLMFSIAICGVLMLGSVGLGIFALLSGLFGWTVSGWASIIFLVTFATTIITLIQGVTAIYVAHIFSEVKGRPRTIIRNTHGARS